MRIPETPLIVLASMAASASAATLSMQFAGGAGEVTLGPGDSATVEIVITMGPSDGGSRPSCLTQIDTRFDVGSFADAGFGPFIEDGSTEILVSGYSTPIPCFGVHETTSPPGVFNGDFFFSVGTPECIVCPVSGSGGSSSIVIARLDLVATGTTPGDVFIVFRNLDPLPTLYNGSGVWSNRFGYDILPNAPNQFVFGLGNPGDADPRYTYHGYEVLEPLVIHQVPEPGVAGLLGLGVVLARLGQLSRARGIRR